MKIGHICLDTIDTGRLDRIAALVEAIALRGVEQHVIVASHALARRLVGFPRVSVGPTVRSPIMAYCLMPDVELVHVHDDKSGQAGLLLKLTRSIPFVITMNASIANDRSPLGRSVLNRAELTIDEQNTASSQLQGSDQLHIYQQALARKLEFPEHADRRH